MIARPARAPRRSVRRGSVLALGLVGLLCAGALRAHDAAADMAAAAQAFLGSLSGDQRAQATYALDHPERVNWHFIPRDRKGLPLNAMSADQRRLALAMLASGLSAAGHAKATNIISLEPVLRELEGANRRFPRDEGLYYVTVFGPPAPAGTWGWRVEGHHLSVNVTIVKGQLFSVTPSFLGSNPAEVRSGPRRGLRVLAAEEDRARALLESLDDAQRRRAVFSTNAPPDIITEARRAVSPLDPVGLATAELRPAQSALLMELIGEYVNRYRPELAAADLRKIREAGEDKIRFAWAGSLERGRGHYYRVQGPTFLLEYDNTQNDANHIHAVWRDFANDFGDDILRRHYAETPHPRAP